MNRYTKYTFFSLFLLLAMNANSSESLEVKYATDILKVLKISDLTIKGLKEGFDAGFSGIPKRDEIVECSINKLHPIVKDHYINTFSTSLNKDVLERGSKLALKESVKKAGEFSFENNRMYMSEAVRKGKRLDVYLLIVASENVSSKKEREEIVAFSLWVEKNVIHYKRGFTSSAVNLKKNG